MATDRTAPLDERGHRARSVQQQLLRHPRRPRLQARSACRCSTSTTSTSASSAATRKATARRTCPPTCPLARSLVPAGTATLRDFSNISPEIPEYIPRTAPAAWTASPSAPTPPSSARCSPRPNWEQKLPTIPRGRPRDVSRASGRRRKKYYDAGKKKAGDGGMFQIIIDPSQVQGLRRVRHRLRRRRPEDDPEDRRR